MFEGPIHGSLRALMDFLRHAEGKKLFAQVVGAPKSKGPRVVLSDWLVERGDPLGEFIAVQLRKPGGKRELELRRAHEADWLGPIHAIADAQTLVFEGGFLTSLRVESSYWPDREFLAALRAATGHPALSLVTSLTLGRGVGGGGAFNEAGGLMSPPREKGLKIPIVGFLAHPVFDRLERLTPHEALRPPVLTALRKARPALELAD